MLRCAGMQGSTLLPYSLLSQVRHCPFSPLRMRARLRRCFRRYSRPSHLQRLYVVGAYQLEAVDSLAVDTSSVRRLNRVVTRTSSKIGNSAPPRAHLACG